MERVNELVNKEFMLKISGLKKSFDEHEVIKGVSLSVKRGEAAAIIGLSGGQDYAFTLY